MIRRQQLFIVIGLAIIAVLLAAYLIFLAPLLNVNDTVEPPELEEGEVLYNNSTFLMHEQLEEDDIEKILIHNDHGEFEFYKRNTSAGKTFVIRNMETATFDRTKFSGILTAVENPIVLQRLKDVTDYAQYGIDYENYYVVGTKNGKEYKVYVGDIASSDGAYYCRIEGRDFVYLLDTSIEYMLNDVYYYVTPYLAMPTTQEDFYKIDDFSMYRDGEKIVGIDYLNEIERESNGTTNFYRMTYPTAYNVAFSSFESITKVFMNLKGTETIMTDHTDRPLSDEVLAEYGLKEPKYELRFKYGVYANKIYVSALNEDGSYYAYSTLFNLLCKVEPANFNFLDWDILKFVDPAMFAVNIYDIASVSVESDSINETFLMSGDDSETFAVRTKNSNKEITASHYREYYMNILTLYLRGYADLEDNSSLKRELKLTVRTRKGVETVYEFYPCSTSHCYYTIDGVGEFYLLRDEVDKLLANTGRLLRGEPVDNSYKN